MNLIIPENYDPVLSLRQTQEAIKYIRDTFQKEFGRALMLERISAPLFVQKSSGLNDNLNGVEKPVSFQINCFENDDMETPCIETIRIFRWGRIVYRYERIPPR